MTKRDSRDKLAAQLQKNKEDLSDWEIVASQPPREPSVSISLRLPPEEADLLQKRAAEQKTSVSAVVRVAIHRYLDPSSAPTVRFVFLGAFSAGPAEQAFTEARTYRDQFPDPQVIEYSA